MLTAILLAIVAVLALWDGVAELRKRGAAAREKNHVKG